MKPISIWTDGGCSPNPGKGGWAALLIYKNNEKIITGNSPHSTNNIMELTAVINALKSLKEPCLITLYTDSNYVKKGITEYQFNWVRNNWKTANNKPVANQELWQQLIPLTQQHKIQWEWVKAHSGINNNERVDQLVQQARNEL